MNLWKVIDWSAGLILVFLLVLIIFAPLPAWADYGGVLLFLVLALGVLSILHSVYVFVKEIPQRRQGELKSEIPQKSFLNVKVKTWKTIGEWAFLLGVIFVFWQFQTGKLGNKECPDLVRGNPESKIVVKYFYSPFCPACWKGEQALQVLIKKYPGIRIESIDARYCTQEILDTGVRGSPAFYAANGTSSKITYGFDLERIEPGVCAIGGCE